MYRSFVKVYSNIAHTFNDILKWTPTSTDTPERMSKAVPSETFSAACVITDPRSVQTAQNEWVTVGCWPPNLTKEQRNDSSSERKCYAAVWAVLPLRPYVTGAHFKVRTDKNALKG